MSATKLRGRARQETRVRVSSSITPTITYVGYTSSSAAVDFSTPVPELSVTAKPDTAVPAAPCKFHACPRPFSTYGRSRRSIPVVLRIRLAISSIEHSVVSSVGMRRRALIASAARNS
jgi:hypothetical protein